MVATNVRSRFMKSAASPGPGCVADASDEDDKICRPLYKFMGI